MEHNDERNYKWLASESINGGCSQESTSKIVLKSCNAEDNMARFPHLLTPSSPAGCEGHHKDFDKTSQNNSNESRTKEIEGLRKQIQTLHNTIHHLKVHCYLYQEALMNVKRGVCVWQEIKEKKIASAAVICHHCGTEQLLNIIAHLQQQVADLKESR